MTLKTHVKSAVKTGRASVLEGLLVFFVGKVWSELDVFIISVLKRSALTHMRTPSKKNAAYWFSLDME
jgi:hypothetical protein